MYLPLGKVADTRFHIQGNEIYKCPGQYYYHIMMPIHTQIYIWNAEEKYIVNNPSW